MIDSARFLRRCLQAPTSTDLDVATAPTDSGMEGYARLQRRLMLATLVISLCAALFAFLRFDLLVARSVARLGGGSRQVGRFQLVVPMLLVVAAAKLPQLELLPAFLGFLLYKPALILQTVIDG